MPSPACCQVKLKFKVFPSLRLAWLFCLPTSDRAPICSDPQDTDVFRSRCPSAPPLTAVRLLQCLPTPVVRPSSSRLPLLPLLTVAWLPRHPPIPAVSPCLLRAPVLVMPLVPCPAVVPLPLPQWTVAQLVVPLLPVVLPSVWPAVCPSGWGETPTSISCPSWLEWVTSNFCGGEEYGNREKEYIIIIYWINI